MKAWEEKRRLELYHKKISQAKAVVKTGACTPTTPHATRYYDLVPLEVLVKNFDLQPYLRKLKEEGFEGQTNRFLTLSGSEFATLLERLKVLPGHKARFATMLDYLRTMSECAETEPESQQQRRVQSAVVSRRQPIQDLTTYSTMKSPPNLHIPRKTFNEFPSIDQDSTIEGEDRYKSTEEDSLDEFEALELELLNAQKRESKRSQPVPQVTKAAKAVRPLTTIVRTKKPEMSTDRTVQKSSPIKSQRYEVTAHTPSLVDSVQLPDDSDIVNTSDNYPAFEESKAYCDSTVIRSISKAEVTTETPEVKLDIEGPFKECTKPREGTGVSIDSWKVHATPAALDIEEMSHCLSEILYQHLINPPKVVGVSLPPAMAHEFERVFVDEEAKAVPQASAIYNFCKNLMWRTQMEREIVVVCLVYLSRFFQKTGICLRADNWKRLAFIALTTGSKVWDDESFENQHFAQAFSLFRADEINAMESVFLTLLDYQLKVTSSEFTSYYLTLHTYAKPGMNSCGAALIDVATLQKLERLGEAALSFRALYGDALLKTM
mmetsp:Transcript_11200/g.22040  ORF Transcript_11200/g.22040 Transcript_11200/m.22040 type:complete len:548 (+) Transcript_11200:52-1695(+)